MNTFSKHVFCLLFLLSLLLPTGFSQGQKDPVTKQKALSPSDSVLKLKLVDLEKNPVVAHADSLLVKLGKKNFEEEKTDTKIFLAVLGLILAILTPVIVDIIQKTILRKNERELVIGELEDMYRHFYRSLLLLNAIDLNNGYPAIFHFKKIKIPEDSIIFSQATFRNMSSKRSQKIYELKLILRNINIELDEVILYMSGTDAKKGTVSKYIGYLKTKLESLQTMIIKETARMKDQDLGTTDINLYKDQKNASITSTTTPQVLYTDKKFDIY